MGRGAAQAVVESRFGFDWACLGISAGEPALQAAASMGSCPAEAAGKLYLAEKVAEQCGSILRGRERHLRYASDIVVRAGALGHGSPESRLDIAARKFLGSSGAKFDFPSRIVSTKSRYAASPTFLLRECTQEGIGSLSYPQTSIACRGLSHSNVRASCQWGSTWVVSRVVAYQVRNTSSESVIQFAPAAKVPQRQTRAMNWIAPVAAS